MILSVMKMQTSNQEEKFSQTRISGQITLTISPLTSLPIQSVLQRKLLSAFQRKLLSAFQRKLLMMDLAGDLMATSGAIVAQRWTTKCTWEKNKSLLELGG